MNFFPSLSRVFSAGLVVLLTTLFCTSSALAIPPNDPTNVRGVVTSSTTAVLMWNDNSLNEDGFIVYYVINNDLSTLKSFPVNPNAGTGVVQIPLNLLANTPYVFAVQATKSGEHSAGANPINLNMGPFNAPSSPTATVQSDGSVLLMWTDNAYTQTGCYIQYRALPDGTFTNVGYIGATNTSVLLNRQAWMAPSGTYEFRLFGFQGPGSAPTVFTAASPTTNTVSIPTLAAPTSLTAAATNETSVHFAIQGTTGNNTGYELEASLAGQNGWNVLGSASDNTSSPYLYTVDAPNMVGPGLAIDFRTRAYYQDANNNRVYSGYSPVATATTPFYPPTNLVATPSTTSPYQISFSWTDNSSAETGYELEYRQQNLASPAAFVSRKITGPNVTSIANLPEFNPGTIYEFRIHAISSSSTSAYYPVSGGVVATTKSGFTSEPYAPATLGSHFIYQLSTSSLIARTSWSVGTLPAGLSFDNASGIISGTLNSPGVFTIPLTTNFADASSHSESLVLRLIRPPAPPQIVAAIPAQTLIQSGSASIALDTKFADPDTDSAMRIVTSQGNLDLVLYSTATPQTVANFLGYVSAYPNTLFHRAPAGFVLQGGGYQVYDSQSDVFEHIPVGAPVANEPGISNTVGTLAMAKVGDNPNSATSEFFVNLGDNSANLDSQNGGFTVFGRVATPSLTGALAALEAFPIGNYNVNVYDPLTSSTTSSTFNDLPYDPSSASFATITSISALPVLTYSITTPPNSTVATATISGSSLQITAVASGSTSVVVGATDVDGNTTTQTVGLTVQNTLAQWAAAQGYTGALASGTADANHNGLTNLQEFAFLANPATATLAQQPQMALTPVASNTYAEITFPVRKFAAGLTYSVEASNTLASNDWTTLWTSNDGFTAPVVSKTVDQSDRTVVTIRDTQAASAVSRRFLRVKLIGP